MTHPQTDTSYSVGGLAFTVSLPAPLRASSLLPSFTPFLCPPACAPLFVLSCPATPAPAVPPGSVALEEQRNDLGRTLLLSLPGGGYRVELSAPGGSRLHVLHADGVFRRCLAWLDPSDSQCGAALSSLLRVCYSQSVLLSGGVSVHASCVVRGGLAYLFMGPSGTGKSTHSRQWLRAFPGTWLLNDDNPVLRVEGGQALAYGSPWSGKTSCYRASRVPVGGLVRLRQGASNTFRPCRGVDAFSAVLPGCSFIRQDALLREGLYDTLSRLSSLVPVGRLSCLPNEASARVCLSGLEEERINQKEINQ